MAANINHVVLGMTSTQQCFVFGTPARRPFKSEEQAGKAMKILDKEYPKLDFVVLPITGFDYEERKPT